MTMTGAQVEVLVEPGESVQDALDRCGPGGVVRLAAGTHTGSVAIRHSGVTLCGEGAGRTVLTPGAVAPSTIPPLHDAPEGVVSGISVHGEDIRDVTVTGLSVRGFTGAGVYAHTVRGLRVVDVEARDNRVWGLYVRECAGAEVSGCHAAGSQYAGIAVSFSPAADALLADNETTASAFGIFIDNSSGVRALRNRCHGNAAGILALNQTYEGELPGGVRDCLIADNDLHDNVLASGGDDPEALGTAGPPISGVGIALIGTERVSVVGNRVHGNRPGGPSVMGAALVLGSSADWGGSDALDNVLLWNDITGNEPFDAQIGVDLARQHFDNNTVGASQPEDLPGCRPKH